MKELLKSKKQSLEYDLENQKLNAEIAANLKKYVYPSIKFNDENLEDGKRPLQKKK